jgi:hypothetical protein
MKYWFNVQFLWEGEVGIWKKINIIMYMIHLAWENNSTTSSTKLKIKEHLVNIIIKYGVFVYRCLLKQIKGIT